MTNKIPPVDLPGVRRDEDGHVYMFSVDEIVANIDALWAEVQGEQEQLIAKVENLAKACAEYDPIIREKGLSEELANRVKLGGSKFSKFVKLGQNAHIWTPAIRPYLTGYYSRDYELAQLSAEQIDAAIEVGVLHRDSTREEIKKLKDRLNEDERPYGFATQSRVVATIRMNDEAPEELRMRLDKLLADIQGLDKKVTVKRPQDANEAFAKAEARYQNKLEKKIREAAKAQVNWRHNKPLGWAATCEEGSFAEIEALLSQYGISFGDLRKQAERENPPPKVVRKRWREATSDATAEASSKEVISIELDQEKRDRKTNGKLKQMVGRRKAAKLIPRGRRARPKAKARSIKAARSRRTSK